MLENLNYLAIITLFLLNLVSLAWQVSTYFKSKEDKVSTSLSFVNLKCTGKMDIRAELINFSEQPIYIKSMAINLVPAGGPPPIVVYDPTSSKLQVEPSENMAPVLVLKEEKPENKPLQSMERRDYYARELDISEYAALAQRAGENVSLVVTTSKGEIHRHEKFWYFFQKAQQYFTADFVERSQANGMSLELVVGDTVSLGEVVVNGEPTPYVADLTSPFQDSGPAMWKTVFTVGAGVVVSLTVVGLAFKLGQRYARTH